MNAIKERWNESQFPQWSKCEFTFAEYFILKFSAYNEDKIHLNRTQASDERTSDSFSSPGVFRSLANTLNPLNFKSQTAQCLHHPSRYQKVCPPITPVQTRQCQPRLKQQFLDTSSLNSTNPSMRSALPSRRLVLELQRLMPSNAGDRLPVSKFSPSAISKVLKATSWVSHSDYCGFKPPKLSYLISIWPKSLTCSVTGSGWWSGDLLEVWVKS